MYVNGRIEADAGPRYVGAVDPNITAILIELRDLRVEMRADRERAEADRREATEDRRRVDEERQRVDEDIHTVGTAIVTTLVRHTQLLRSIDHKLGARRGPPRGRNGRRE